jgi:SAM-dependent methyltransferase
MIETELDAVLGALPSNATVLDVGCYGWRLAGTAHRLIGIDRVEPPGRPAGVAFATMHGARIDLPDDTGDLTVASHVLEHIAEPVAFFAELVRITRPGQLIWLESPSELATQPRSSDAPEDHEFRNFWDDPTHIRPWPPAALYRLALTCHCRPLTCLRAESGMPVSRLIAQKPASLFGAPTPRYVTLRDIPAGLPAAWAALWPAT